MRASDWLRWGEKDPQITQITQIQQEFETGSFQFALCRSRVIAFCVICVICGSDFCSTLRIIAGKYRGRNLKSPPSLEVRPTSDRLRETLFNVLAPRIADANFLDLCAGSGAVGIEALSRGARHATFVDRSRKMCALVKSNLDLCGIDEDESAVVLVEALDYLRRVLGQRRAGFDPWDIIFFDPPYADDHSPVLETFGAHAATLLTANALLVVEHHHKNELRDEVGSIIRSRILKQGDSALSFYECSDPAATANS